MSRARKAPGVLAVYTGADIKDKVIPVPCAWNVPDAISRPRPIRCSPTARCATWATASRWSWPSRAGAARDAIDLIDVDYDPLPRHGRSREASAKKGAPQLHDDVPKNIAFTWKVAGGDADAAFRDAAVSVKTRLVHQRLQPTAMEPRAAVASYNPGTGQLSLWVSSQNPHIHRFLCSVMLKIPEHRVRVIAGEVGGGFGSKIPVYADEALVGFASMDLGRPVKWTEDRSENYKATIHGRDHVQYVELCGTKDGTITGLRTEVYAGMGAYASTAGPGVPTILHGLIYPGPYTIPNVRRHDLRRLHQHDAGGRVPRRRPPRGDAPARTPGRPVSRARSRWTRSRSGGRT